MRKIYKVTGQDDSSEAWVGDSAPIPDGWHLDLSSANDAYKQTKKETPRAVQPERKQRGAEELVDLDAMDKGELEAFAKERWGIDLDKRKKRESLLEEVHGYLGAE